MIKFLQKRKPIKNASILLTGPVRNVEDVIENEIKILERSLCNFNEVHTLIVESDSTDKTLEVLSNLKKNYSNFEYISLGSLQKKLRNRTERIARARNEIVKQVMSNPKYRHIDFIMMADMDGMNNLVSPEKIDQCWKVTEDWDVITAVQKEEYYDIWTLRHPDWCPDNCWGQKDRLETLIGEAAAINLAVTSRQVRLRPEYGLIEVDSAFGGLGIYKREAFIAGKYGGLDINGKETSDHIQFHKILREKGYRIFINCALINCSKYPDPITKPEKGRISPALKLIQKLGHLSLGKKRFDYYLRLLISKKSNT